MEYRVFGELYRFIRESTGLAIAVGYLILLLSSMCYIYVLYSAFDINIVKFVTFEDILATPIKNPDIIFCYLLLISVMYIHDVGDRYRLTLRQRHGDQPPTLFLKVLQRVFWAPKNHKTNIRLTVVIVAASIFMYIVTFAQNEAEEIQLGQGTLVELVLADDNKVISTTLLGTTVNHIFTYQPEREESVVYYMESVKSIRTLPQKKAPENQLKKGEQTVTKPENPPEEDTK